MEREREMEMERKRKRCYLRVTGVGRLNFLPPAAVGLQSPGADLLLGHCALIF